MCICYYFSGNYLTSIGMLKIRRKIWKPWNLKNGKFEKNLVDFVIRSATRQDNNNPRIMVYINISICIYNYICVTMFLFLIFRKSDVSTNINESCCFSMDYCNRILVYILCTIKWTTIHRHLFWCITDREWSYSTWTTDFGW
jgi:hypothetical protein